MENHRLTRKGMKIARIDTPFETNAFSIDFMRGKLQAPCVRGCGLPRCLGLNYFLSMNAENSSSTVTLTTPSADNV